MFDSLQYIDTAVILFLNEALPAGVTFFFNIFTYAGYYGISWIIFFIIISLRTGKKDFSLYWGSVFTACFLLFEVAMKNLVHRSRPYTVIPDLLMSTSLPSSYSFPSSHAVLSGAAMFILLSLKPGKTISAAIILYALLVSLSRVVLKVHYPSDVISGFFFGIFTAYMFKLILDRRSGTCI